MTIDQNTFSIDEVEHFTEDSRPHSKLYTLVNDQYQNKDGMLKLSVCLTAHRPVLNQRI